MLTPKPLTAPIPFAPLEDTVGYHAIPIADKHPLRHDPMVKTEDYGLTGQSYYAREDGKNAPFNRRINGSIPIIWCRREVALRLQLVNRKLQPLGRELFVFDGYRPITCQQGLWDFFVEKTRKQMPGAADAAIDAHVRKFISDPRRFNAADQTTWPTHSTGGAVDVMLRSSTGALLDMGGHYDEDAEHSHTDYYERQLRDGKIGVNHPALLNRRMLYWAMASEGFVNYSYEFWHYDWGTQMYIRNAQLMGDMEHTEAWYGYVPIPQ